MFCQLFPHLSCLLAFGFTILFFYKWRSLRNKATPPLPPGPIGYPIVGCLPSMIMNKPISRWIHRFMEEMKTEIACFRLGNSLIIPVSSPELAREFLKKHDAILSMRPVATSTRVISKTYPSVIFRLQYFDNQWKKMRMVHASNVLSSSMYKQLHHKRCAEYDEFTRYIYNQLQSPFSDGLVDMRTVSRFYCSNVIMKMVFNQRYFGTGEKDGGPGAEDREHMDAIFTSLSYIYGFAISYFVPWLEVFDFDGHKKTIADATEKMRKYQDLIIDQRIAMWQRGAREEEEDILDMLINLKDSENIPLLTSEEIKAQIYQIMLAATDNSSNAIEWSLAEMINQPSILEKACEEFNRVVGRDRLVQESDLPKLNYIKACAKESFRMHPIAAFNVPHVPSKDVVVGGYLIPKGSQVLLSRPGLGRNPRVWENHLRYNPERHIVDDPGVEQVVLTDNDLHMLSFSTGRRGCPAPVLGSTLTIMPLVSLIQGFHWKAPPNGPGTIDLAECEDQNFQMKKPLIAQATPRLEPKVYRSTSAL